MTEASIDTVPVLCRFVGLFVLVCVKSEYFLSGLEEYLHSLLIDQVIDQVKERTTMSISTSGGASLASVKTEQLSNISTRNSTYSSDSGGGSLTAEVLSVYDLLSGEPPLYVSFSTATKTVHTGPPFAKHKDRNSFRFSAPNQNTSAASNPQAKNPAKVQLKAPLSDLYNSTINIQVQYQNSYKDLRTSYVLNQLKVHETKWLILTLSDDRTIGGQPEYKEGDDSSEEIAPTIRLKLTLVGPYRTEIAALVGIAQAWFRFVDQASNSTGNALSNVPTAWIQTPWMILPAVPVLGLVVVLSPAVVALCMVFLPFLLPLLLVLIVGAAALLLGGGMLYFSTASGRANLEVVFGPLLDSFLASKTGQGMIYQTGPRPTPVSVARLILPTKSLWGKLVVSLIIDLLGSASYLLPVVGEGLDIAWAPLQTIAIMAMYDRTSPNLKYVSFVEEILPFTDIVPTATIGFLLEFVPKLLSSDDGNGEDTKVVVEAMNTLLSTAKQATKRNNNNSTTPVRNGTTNPYRR